MILAYPLRLLCVSLATFFLVHAVAGLGVLAMTPGAVRLAERMSPRSASRWLLLLRLSPLACSLFVVAALCVPSYLWLEPASIPEEVGFACLSLALLGAAVCGVALARGLGAAIRSGRYINRCLRSGFDTHVQVDSSPVWVTESAAGSLMLAGILHPRILISPKVVNALSASQLAAALQHESAHRVSRDNLKRLLILLGPDILPFFRGFETLERHWARFTEWAADDRAVAGDAHRALSLAGALVRIARLGHALCSKPVICSLFDDGRNLAARIDRLLCVAPSPERHARPMRIARSGAALVLTGLAVLIAILRPATLYSVHRLLERLIA